MPHICSKKALATAWTEEYFKYFVRSPKKSSEPFLRTPQIRSYQIFAKPLHAPLTFKQLGSDWALQPWKNASKHFGRGFQPSGGNAKSFRPRLSKMKDTFCYLESFCVSVSSLGSYSPWPVVLLFPNPFVSSFFFSLSLLHWSSLQV